MKKAKTNVADENNTNDRINVSKLTAYAVVRSWKESARKVGEAETENFAELIRLSGLDPKRHLRFADWSDIDFSGADLRGFDFTGARLHGCRFDGARIAGARFDQAELGMVERMTGPWRRDNPHAPGVVTEVANLREAADWREFAAGWQRTAGSPDSDAHLPVGAIFTDAPVAPEMIVVPSGAFMMGSPPDETERRDSEGPRHPVTIAEPFAIGRCAVTFAEWDAFVAAERGARRPGDEGWGREDRPVINVDWDDAKAYVAWLRKVTGKDYRLLTEAEWEYASRAGTETPFWWGSSISTDQANYDGNYTYRGGTKGEYQKKTLPVKSFAPNPWGLYQVHGNVWEWTEDGWHDNHANKPDDLKASARPWTAGSTVRVLRGGSWDYYPDWLRSANRFRSTPGLRSNRLGFRVARTLTS
jgi:formylglycine-generating enzyme required for sulfatase activity